MHLLYPMQAQARKTYSLEHPCCMSAAHGWVAFPTANDQMPAFIQLIQSASTLKNVQTGAFDLVCLHVLLTILTTGSSSWLQPP